MLRQLPNPDNEPRYVTTSYQRQNENLFAVQTGIDTTNPYDDGTNVIVPIGGVVEVNGVMYSVTAEVTLTKPDPDTAYWIVVVPSADGSAASFELVTRPGVWFPDRQGCYFTEGEHNNRRTLNWVSKGTLADIPSGEGDAYSKNTKINRDIISLKRGWHYVALESGAGGGNANGVNGGVASNRNNAEMIFFADKPFYNVKVGGSGQNGANSPAGNGIRGGGGGGGSGEESVFDGLSTGIVPPGNGGNGAPGGDWGNIPGGVGGRNGGNGESGRNDGGMTGGIGGFGGAFFGGSGGGGGSALEPSDVGTSQRGLPGGAGGNGGQSQREGSPGGSCNIFALGN